MSTDLKTEETTTGTTELQAMHDGLAEDVVNACVTDHPQHHHKDDAATSAMIAEATAAAIEAAAVEVDVSAAENAAALGVHDSAEELHEKPKGHRRKRFREKTEQEEEAKIQKNARSTGSGKTVTHEEQLALRREKDRVRYASMSEEQRHEYNQKRREQYHRQNELTRQKRRERERNRYHSLDKETAKERNERRAKLERERYQKMTQEELEAKNRRRRERAALARQKKDAEKMLGTATAADIAAEAAQVVAATIKQEKGRLLLENTM